MRIKKLIPILKSNIKGELLPHNEERNYYIWHTKHRDIVITQSQYNFIENK